MSIHDIVAVATHVNMYTFSMSASRR